MLQLLLGGFTQAVIDYTVHIAGAALVQILFSNFAITIILCGEKYAILIDTGLGVSNIRKIVDSLTKLPVMTVTTHVHWDHIGGHKYFDNIAVHEAEKDWLSVRFPIPLQVVKNNLTRLPCDFPRDFDINAYQIFQGIPQRILHDGDFLNLGGREIQVVHTPGHSPGHCCFYEPERNYLYSGDLISQSIMVSALSFFAATIGVGLYSNIDMISSLCILMARGALISMVVVIFVLPSMFMVFDKVIVKTSKGFLPPKE